MKTRENRKVSPGFFLAGDVGGTKARLGLFQFTRHRFRETAEEIFASKDYRGLEEIIERFLRGKKKISAACFGVAGPVVDGSVVATNLPWRLDRALLRKTLQLQKVDLINDLVANALGISRLEKEDFVVLNPGTPRKGNAVLLSAGTGLGEAILFWDGQRYLPSPSEGGHVDFPPRNTLELELLQYLMNRFSRVSYERVLSGMGVLQLYQFLKETKRFGAEPRWLTKALKRGDRAAVISEAARLGKSRLCSKTLDLFASIYGAAAGNLALHAMAAGGVYLGGGIAPKIIWKLKEGSFMKAFLSKGRLSAIVAPIPVKVILNDRAALLGAACRAMELCSKDLSR